MAPSIERRLIGGVWQTVEVNEGGGGPSGPVTAGDIDSTPGGAGEVLTADGAGAASWEPSGGSVPGMVRLLDLGVVNSANLADGDVLLYTPGAGEIVGPVILRDVVLQDSATIVTAISRDEEVTDDDFLPPLAGWDNDVVYDFFVPEGPGVTATTTGPVVARFETGLPSSGTGRPVEPWQANHAYDGSAGNVFVIGSDGHSWTTDGNGTSGPTEPDFAGNEGGTVLDNDITWTDNGALPAAGSAHVYAYSSVPVVP